MMERAIVRFAVLDHDHLVYDHLADPAHIVRVLEVWSGSTLSNGICYAGKGRRLSPLHGMGDVSELIAQIFPGIFYLSTHSKPTDGEVFTRWSIDLRKTAALAFVELCTETEMLVGLARSLPQDHERVARSIPGRTELGFISCVELPYAFECDSGPELGRFAQLAVADFVDPAQAIHDSESRILAALSRGKIPADIHEIQGRLHVNWVREGDSPVKACKARLAWLNEAADSS